MRAVVLLFNAIDSICLGLSIEFNLLIYISNTLYTCLFIFMILQYAELFNTANRKFLIWDI